MPGAPTSIAFGQAQFPATLWSMVLAAKASTPESHNALAALCQAYWHPLYAFLRRQGKNRHDAEDLTQGFFLHLFERNALDTVQPERGRFRSFLLASLQNFLADEYRKGRAQKRGGGSLPISLDTEQAEKHLSSDHAGRTNPEELFDLRWALTLLDITLTRLEREYAGSGKHRRFEELHVFLVGGRTAGSYADAAKRLGMTEGAVKVAVLRLRQRYRELLRAEVANTVATDAEIEEEMRHLSAIVAS